jgi:hypothetical protein
MKKWISGLVGAATIGSLTATAALLVGLLNLPGFQVGTSHVWLGTAGPNSTFLVTLSGVGAGFDVQDGDYNGWCVEDNGVPPAAVGTLYDSTDAAANLPALLQQVPWDKVNYVLNNKGLSTVEDIQIALWMLAYGASSLPVTPGAQALLDAANANGAGFVPGEGDLAAVIVYSDGIQAIGNTSIQESIIEVEVPDQPDGDGCTPGFWKNDGGKFGFKNWIPTGYSPSDDFNTEFGVNYLPAGTTLLESLTPTNNNGYGNLIWHGTAALLNAAHPGVDYPYTVAQVIAFVQSGSSAPLVLANEAGCPLSRIKSGD